LAIKKESQYARQRRLFQTHGVRSKLEKRGKDVLDDSGLEYEYESVTFEYEVPEKVRKYTPDFKVGDKYYEFKGHWDVEDRQKHVLFKAQRPEVDLTMVFHRPLNKINRLSNTSYAAFCDKHGIPWMSIEDFEKEYGHVRPTIERKAPTKASITKRKAATRRRVRIEKEIGQPIERVVGCDEPKPGTSRVVIHIPGR